MGSFPQTGVELVAKGLGEFQGTLRSGAGAVQDFGRMGSLAADQVAKSTGVMSGALNAVGGMATNAIAGAGQALVGFGQQSVDAASQFQSSMGNLQAVAEADLAKAGYSLDDVQKKALELGAVTQYSAQEALGALTTLVQGGVDVKTAMGEGTEATLGLAAAAGIDLEMASTVVAKSLGVWSSTGVTATQVANTFSQAVNASTMNAQDLSLAVFNAQGAAKNLGVTYDDLVQVTAQVSKGFNTGAEAGTAIKYLFAGLQPSTAKATEAFEALGLMAEDGANAFFDANGQFIGTRDAIDKLSLAMKDLDPETKSKLIRDMFGQEAMSAVSILLEEGAAGFDKVGEAMQASGDIASQAEVRNTGYAFSMDTLKGSIETVQIILGSKFLPILESLINQYMIPAVNIVGDLTMALSGDAEAFAKLPAPVQQVTTVVQQVINAFNENGLAGVLRALLPGFSDTEGGLNSLGGVFNQLKVTAENVWKGIQQVTSAVLPVIQKFYTEHGDEIMAFFKKTFDTIVTIIKTALQVYNAIVPPILNAIASFISDHGATIVAYLEGAWKVISGAVELALDIILGVLDIALNVIEGDWEGAWTAVQNLTRKVIDDIVKIVSGLGQMLENAMKMAVDAAKRGWNSFADWSGLGGSVVDGIVKGLLDNAGKLFDEVAKLAKKAWEKAMSVLGAKSPSTLFAEGPGEAIATGTAKGITDNQNVIDQAITRAMVQPAMSAQALLMQGSGPSVSTSTSTRTYHMPIYTNQSPAVLRQSLAVLEATAL